MRKPTIKEIADNNNSPFYFSAENMRFFGQRRCDFRVYVTKNPNVFRTECPISTTMTLGNAPLLGNIGIPCPKGMKSIAFWLRDENGQFTKVSNPEQEN